MPLVIDIDPMTDLLMFLAGNPDYTFEDVRGNLVSGEQYRNRIPSAPKDSLVVAQDVDVACELSVVPYLQGDPVTLTIPAIEAICP